MTDPSQESGPSAEDLPQPVVRTRRVSASLIWLVPALAAVVGAWLVIRNYLEAGPAITISFQTAEGLEAAKTPVKYKNVVIGVVHGLRLSPDRDHVLVNVELQKNAQSFATADTRFWVVRPRIGLSGISGVDTLLSGPFIAADIGDSTESSREFIGLETPPSVIHGTRGKSFRLHTRDLGSIDVGSPIYFRRLPVGHVSSYRLEENGKGITIDIFIDGPNDQFVNKSTRFWNASGVDVSVGTSGLKVNTQSIASVIAGGIAFQDLPAPHDATPSPADSDFDLYGNLATAMLPPDGEPTYVRMRFSQSLRGLEVDAPVEFLGIDVGHVVSINIDYDEKTQQFPIIVGAVIYGQRLGRAQTKLAARAAKHGSDADMSHTFALARRTRAARGGAQRQSVDRAAVDQPGFRSEGPEGRLRRRRPAARDSNDDRQLQPPSGAIGLDSRQGRCDTDRPHRRASRRFARRAHEHAQENQRRSVAGIQRYLARREFDVQSRRRRAVGGFSPATKPRPDPGGAAPCGAIAARIQRLSWQPPRGLDPRPPPR